MSHESFVTFSFKQNEVLLDKPYLLGFAVIEMSKLLM